MIYEKNYAIPKKNSFYKILPKKCCEGKFGILIIYLVDVYFYYLPCSCILYYTILEDSPAKFPIYLCKYLNYAKKQDKSTFHTKYFDLEINHIFAWDSKFQFGYPFQYL